MNCPIFHLPKRKIDQIASPSPSHVHANPIPPANLSAHIEFPQINEFLMDKWYTIVCLIPKINFTQQNRKNDRKLSESFFSFWPPRTLFFGPTIATQSLSVIFFFGKFNNEKLMAGHAGENSMKSWTKSNFFGTKFQSKWTCSDWWGLGGEGPTHGLTVGSSSRHTQPLKVAKNQFFD